MSWLWKLLSVIFASKRSRWLNECNDIKTSDDEDRATYRGVYSLNFSRGCRNKDTKTKLSGNLILTLVCIYIIGGVQNSPYVFRTLHETLGQNPNQNNPQTQTHK